MKILFTVFNFHPTINTSKSDLRSLEMKTLSMLVLLIVIHSYSCLELQVASNIIDVVEQVGSNLIQPNLVDSDRNPCQLIESRGFICDEHFVITEDNYILSIQHVINTVLLEKNLTTIKPLVIQHGLFGSATHWLINSEGGFAADWTGQVIDQDLNIEGRNAPYLLSNLGYDVWIPNLRGCKYSRNHTYLDPDTDSEYWNFSYEQMITHDAPTIIDYVLKQTGHDKLGWIGHSLGTTIMFGLLSERPEYSAKIKPFIALAPVAYTGHVTTPLRLFADLPALKEILSLKNGELNLPSSVIDLVSDGFCVLPINSAICSSIFYIFGGYEPEQFNISRISVYTQAGFCGTSVRTLVHFGYNIAKNQFAKFDYGLLGNSYEYNSLSPPLYNLSAINLRHIVLIDSKYDPLADPIDVSTLKSLLTVPFIEYSVQYPKFSHLDFLWAKNVYSQVYEPMVRFLKKFEVD